MLSKTAKEAIKTALAMTLTYGIALAMDWDNPLWAGLAVAVVSLPTVGQSLNKGAMRMLGTLVAAVVALIILALFVQDRWLFMIALSAWVGFCTYMMGGTKWQYFWNMSGMVCIIIVVGAGADSANAFATAILRAQQTGLGILVYSVVSILLWPSHTGAQFEAAARKRASTQHQLYRACLSIVSKSDSPDDIPGLRTQLMQEQNQFDQLLDAAEADSAEISAWAEQWRRYRRQALELSEALEHWREGFPHLQALDLHLSMPELERFSDELDRRLGQIERMLGDQRPEHLPAKAELAFDLDVVRGLRQFEKAALSVTRARLQKLESLTRSAFESVAAIKGFGEMEAAAGTGHRPASAPLFLLDPDRNAAVIRVVVTMWAAFLAWIYVDALPGGSSFLTIASVFMAAFAYMPQMRMSVLYKPLTVGILFGTALYMFVMPKLSGFLELGLLLFVVTFAVQYFFASPRQVLMRMMALVMFISVASISNQQSYSFYVFSTMALLFPLAFTLLAITSHIPVSPLPERAFMRLLGRYFRSSGYLMWAIRWDRLHSETRSGRRQLAFHVREVVTLPGKMRTWLPHLDAERLGGDASKPIQVLVNNLQSLSYRLQELVEERDSPQSPVLVQELGEDLETWRLAVQTACQRLAKTMPAVKRETLRAQLDEMLERLDADIEGALDRAAGVRFSERDAENFYRLLDAYRGVSEALVSYAENAGAIDWAPWREERFA